MGVENDNRNGEVPNRKSRRFYVTYDWMPQAVPDHLVHTYACVWAMQKAGMSCSAAEIGRRLRRTEGTIRRHIRELVERGLWRRERRGANGVTLANRYVFCRLAVMPDDAASERHVADDTNLPGADATEVGGVGAIDRMARALGDKMTCKEAEGHANKRHSDALLSPELIAALQTASPRHVDDCIRLLHYETRNMPADQARALVIIAVRQFIERMERGGVENPPGLLRTIVRSASSQTGEPAATMPGSSEVARTIRGLDMELQAARSPFGVRKKARKRSLFYRQLCASLGSAPADLAAVPEFDGARGALVTEMVRAQLAWLGAAAANDGTASSVAESRINEVERELERLLATEKGAAE